jgi:CspA family cold shock protein
MDERITGVVRWFDPAKGYGFLASDRGGKDVFCHHSAIKMDGYKTLNEGDKVTFSVISGAKGPQADAVLVV